MSMSKNNLVDLQPKKAKSSANPFDPSDDERRISANLTQRINKQSPLIKRILKAMVDREKAVSYTHLTLPTTPYV